jgi:hypothetical protein
VRAVEDRPPVRAQQDVVRRDAAVQLPLALERAKRNRDLEEDHDDLVEGKRAAERLDVVRKIAARNELVLDPRSEIAR